MKKGLLPLLAAVLLLTSCAADRSGTGTDAATLSAGTSAPSVAAAIPNADLADREAEVDMTAMSTQMAYVQLSNMMTSPQDYQGKTVKLRGTFAHAAEGGRDFFVCYIMDETACCSQSIEFETDETYAFPEDYPPEQSGITVYGVFDTYEYNGYKMYRLLHAELSY